MQEYLNISYQNDMLSYKDRNRITVKIWESTIASSLSHVSIQVSNQENEDISSYYSLWVSNILPILNDITFSDIQEAYRYDISKENKSPDWVFCFIGRGTLLDCDEITDQIIKKDDIVYHKVIENNDWTYNQIGEDCIYAVIQKDDEFIDNVYNILRRVINFEWPRYDYEFNTGSPPPSIRSKEVFLKHLINAKFIQIRQQYPGSQKRIDEEETLWEEIINKKYNYLCHCTKLTILLLLIGTLITAASYITHQYNPLLKNIGWSIFCLSLAILLILACYSCNSNKTIIQPQSNQTSTEHKPLQMS